MTDTATDSLQLLTDVPSNEDALGFKPHASNLAAMLLKQQFPDASFVVGIEGVWGEGKSTFIKFLKKRFSETQSGEVPPVVVDFNPWWFESPEKIMTHLLDSMLGQADKLEAEARDQLIKFAEVVRDNSQGVEKFTNSLLYVNGFLGAGVVSAAANGYWVGVVLALILGVFAKFSHDYLQRQKIISESLPGKKKALSEKFSKNKQKLVVIIDDLDRLSHEEVRQVFRAVKGVLDLPNIVYVIAYDRTIVASALDEVHKGRGEAYLEKIIQYTYPLPRPHAKQKLTYNKKVIAQYLTDLPGGIDYYGVSKIVEAFLPVPRSVKRLSAALLDYRLGVQDGMEMDALDYLFLEAVRHFDMRVYSELSRAIFFSHQYCQLNHAHSLSGQETPSARVAWVKERFEYTLKNYVHHPEVMGAIHFFTGFVFSGDQENVGPQGYRTVGSKLLTYIASKEKNQAGRKLFRAYLARGRDEGDVSRQELEAFASIKDADALESYLQSIELPRVESLLEDLSNGWNVIFQNASSKDFIWAWSYALQRNISAGKEYFYGIELGNVLEAFIQIVEKDWRSPLGWASGPVDAMEKWLGRGDLDDLLYRLVLNGHFIVGLRGEDYPVIARLSDEFDLSRMLTGGYFIRACKVIKEKSEKSIEEWLANIDAQGGLTDYQLRQLMDFIASDFVAEGYADALIENEDFQQLLKGNRWLIARAIIDKDLQQGIDRLTGVA